jgi:hypothetical protein
MYSSALVTEGPSPGGRAQPYWSRRSGGTGWRSASPQDRSAIDDYQLVWTIWRSNSDEEMRRFPPLTSVDLQDEPIWR